MFDLPLAGAIAVKTGLLLLLAAAVGVVATKKSSAFRHALWTGTLLLSLLMPVAVLTLPSLDVIPASWELQEPAASATAAPAIQALPALDLWAVASQLWIAIALVFLMRLLVLHLGLLRWQHRARPLHSRAWTGTLEHLSSRMPTRRSLRVLESPEFTNPCTWGFVRPVLLLPAGGESWTEAERRLALLHELAHVRRYDWLTATLGQVACAVHWYNPLVWLAARESRRLQEQACDDFVLQSGALPSHYASFLRHAAANEQDETPRLAAALGIVRRSELRERVDSILDPQRRRMPLSGARAFALWLTSVCIALFLGVVAQESPADGSDPADPEVNVAEEGFADEEFAGEESFQEEISEEDSEEFSDEDAQELADDISDEVADEISAEVESAVAEALEAEAGEEEEASSPAAERSPIAPVAPVPPVPPMPPVAPVPPVSPAPPVPPVPPAPPEDHPAEIRPDSNSRVLA